MNNWSWEVAQYKNADGPRNAIPIAQFGFRADALIFQRAMTAHWNERLGRNPVKPDSLNFTIREAR